MGALATVFFLLAFLVACVRPSIALALLILMFPLEQLLQSANPVLLSSKAGLLFVNALAASTAGIAAARLWFAGKLPFKGLFNPAYTLTWALLGWSAASLAWTPSWALASSTVMQGLPYMLVTLGLGALLLTDLATAEGMLKMLLLLGSALCCFIILNPEFQTRWGRLGFDLGGGVRSSALALGEAGGLTLLTAMLMRFQVGWRAVVWNVIRAVGLISGLYVGIQSGSRGQVLFSLAVGFAFYPFAAPVKNVGRAVLTILGLLALVSAFAVLMNTLLYGFDAQRFSVDELLYGRSSTTGRVQNVLVLLSAWASNPLAWIFGLGFLAFNSLYSGQLDPYSHVVIADVIFEEGLVGAVFGILLLIMSFRGFGALLRQHASDPRARATLIALASLATYSFLLANKQGHLWGISGTLFFLCAGARLQARESAGLNLLNPEGAAPGTISDEMNDDHPDDRRILAHEDGYSPELPETARLRS